MSPKVSVLVVDDDALVGQTIVALLSAEGYRVARALNGYEALDLIGTEHFDLVISDIYMPDMDGIELLRHLRRQESAPAFVAISGGGRTVQVDYLGLAQRLGARAILRKPFTRAQLRATVERALAPHDELA